MVFALELVNLLVELGFDLGGLKLDFLQSLYAFLHRCREGLEKGAKVFLKVSFATNNF